MKLILIMILSCASIACAAEVKEADLAGTWYPKSKIELGILLESYLNAAKPDKVEGRIFALVSPHAGYQFSGSVAAYGFKAVKDTNVKTVIVIGFSHRKRFDGISVYAGGSWRTPLGDIKIDETLAKEIISKNPRFSFEPSLFDEENSVEMQIPFIQAALDKDVKIVPIAFGTQDYNDAEVLAEALGEVLKARSDCLVVASTDLSHYHPYEEANAIDRHTLSLLDARKAKELYDEAAIGVCELCGMMPVVATLLAAKKLRYDDAKILKYANSGDTAHDRRKVVGYVSAVLYKKNRESRMLNELERKRLLEIAREAITSYVMDGKRKDFATELDPMLNEPMGAFVTLHEEGGLRGCIGNIVGHEPLHQTVASMAIEAATGDPRFPPLSAAEIEKVNIEISVLSPLRRVSSYEEVEIPGHGVLIRRGFKSGVYLPQVATETGWDRERFLTSLCADKAGLPPAAWKDRGTEIYVFSAEVFGERGEERKVRGEE